MTRSENMKEKYTPAELEVILFGLCDVITTSGSIIPPDDEDENAGGSGIGGGYNPGGWT